MNIGFTAVKNTACLLFLTSLPPGINPDWMIECVSWELPTWWMCSAKSLANSALSCNVGSMCFLPEWPLIARKCRMISSSIHTVLISLLRTSSFFASNSAMFELTTTEKTQILNETSVPRFWIWPLPLLLEVLKDRVEAIWSSFLTLRNNSCRTDLVRRQSNHAGEKVTYPLEKKSSVLMFVSVLLWQQRDGA